MTPSLEHFSCSKNVAGRHVSFLVESRSAINTFTPFWEGVGWGWISVVSSPWVRRRLIRVSIFNPIDLFHIICPKYQHQNRVRFIRYSMDISEMFRTPLPPLHPNGTVQSGIGGSRGVAGAPPKTGPDSFVCAHVFTKKYPCRRSAPPSTVGAPDGKSWICN